MSIGGHEGGVGCWGSVSRVGPCPASGSLTQVWAGGGTLSICFLNMEQVWGQGRASTSVGRGGGGCAVVRTWLCIMLAWACQACRPGPSAGSQLLPLFL